MKPLTWMRGMAVAVAALLLAACGGGDGPTPAAPDASMSSRIYMLAAPSGQLQPGDSPTQWTLVLDQPEPSAFWFEDRPLRGSGEQALADYVGATWPQAYGSIAPHATLHFQKAGDADLQALYAALGRPAYDAAARQLRVPLTIHANSVQTDGGALNIANLFLQVLNNAVDDQGAAFYLQHAGQATLQPEGASGQYRLVLEGVVDTTLLVSSAPSRYNAGRSTADFSAAWNDSFAGSAPNAAFYGSTSTGEVRLYFLTLGAPRYDAATRTLSYAATVLGGGGPGQALALEQVTLNIDSAPFVATASIQCKDYNGNPVAVPPKTISLYNNSQSVIYPVLTVGEKPIDQWLQGCFRTREPYTDTHFYKLFVNEGTGLAPQTSVTITLPLYSELAAPEQGHITWWNGGRVTLADDNTRLQQVGDHRLQAIPQGLACQGRATDCRLSVYSRRDGLPVNIYAQLSEYTFGDSVEVSGQSQRLLKPDNVGYNISYVDHVYMPVAIGVKNNPYIGYSGSALSLERFKAALRAFLTGPTGQGWPVYNMTELRLPSGYNIFAERDGTLSPKDDVPVKPPAIPPAAEGFPPVLTVLECLQGRCTDEQKATRHFGEAVQRMQNLWGSCVDWGAEDVSKYVTADIHCGRPELSDLREKLRAVYRFFAQSHANYLQMYREGKCSGTVPQRPVFNYWEAITHIYGWVPFNEGCGADANPLAETKIAGWDHAKIQFMYIHDLQYNYLNPAYAHAPELQFNPYVKLIHQDLGMSAYGFSVDDAVGFMSELGDGLIFAVGSPNGLENQEQFNYSDGFSVAIGVTALLERNPTQPLLKRYGVCVLNRSASDPQCENINQDVVMPGNSQISGFRVGTVKSGAQSGYPLKIRFTDLDDNVYTLRVNEPFATCPADLDDSKCPTNKERIVDQESCIVIDRNGKEAEKSKEWCRGANPNQKREKKEAQVIKNFLSFPEPVDYYGKK